MLTQLSRREKLTIIIGLLILLSAFYYFYVYLPYKQKINQLNLEIEKTRQKIPVLLNFSEKIPELKQKLANKEKTDKSKSEYTPQSISEQMHLFFTMGEKNNTELMNFSPKEATDKIELSLTYRGEFTDIVSLYQDFNKLNDDFTFQRFSLQPHNNKLTADLMVIFYKGGQSSNEK